METWALNYALDVRDWLRSPLRSKEELLPPAPGAYTFNPWTYYHRWNPTACQSILECEVLGPGQHLRTPALLLGFLPAYFSKFSRGGRCLCSCCPQADSFAIHRSIAHKVHWVVPQVIEWHHIARVAVLRSWSQGPLSLLVMVCGYQGGAGKWVHVQRYRRALIHIQGGQGLGEHYFWSFEPLHYETVPFRCLFWVCVEVCN